MVNIANFLRISSRASRCRINTYAVRAAPRSSHAAASAPAETHSQKRCIFRSSGGVFKSSVENPLKRFYNSSPKSGGEEGTEAPAPTDYSSQLSEKDFHEVANETLHHLQEKIEELGDRISIDGFDTDYAEGVLTVRLGDLGTYVINKQTPNRQIWLSSPVSGPSRYDWLDSKWVYHRTKAELRSLLQKEFSDLLGKSIDLSEKAKSMLMNAEP